MKSKYFAMTMALASICGLFPKEKPKQLCKFEKIRMKGLSAEEMGTAGRKKKKNKGRKGA
ncbi:MAG: hypothetical protein NC548_39035 [Lachnospiraceae bacterium]|nr:hypothetical protein [Lachnospiraceae bacterium]